MKISIKYLFILIALTVTTFSCKKDYVSEDSFEENLKIDIVREFLPQSYFQKTILVYKNSAKEELKLVVNSKESSAERFFDQKKYTSEQFEITLYNPKNLLFQIILTGNTNYSNSGEIVTTLGGILMPFNSSGSTWSTIRFDNNKPTVSFGDDFHEKILLLDNEFDDVYVTIGKDGNTQHSAYSELDINSKNGVVAFRDENNELWVWDRIE